jgi:hypothetical protein
VVFDLTFSLTKTSQLTDEGLVGENATSVCGIFSRSGNRRSESSNAAGTLVSR